MRFFERGDGGKNQDQESLGIFCSADVMDIFGELEKKS